MRHNTVLSVLAGYWGNWAVVTFKRKCMGPTRLHASIKSWSSTLLPSHWQIKARDPHLTKSQLHSDSVFNPGPCTAGSRGVKSPKTSKHLQCSACTDQINTAALFCSPHRVLTSTSTTNSIPPPILLRCRDLFLGEQVITQHQHYSKNSRPTLSNSRSSFQSELLESILLRATGRSNQRPRQTYLAHCEPRYRVPSDSQTPTDCLRVHRSSASVPSFASEINVSLRLVCWHPSPPPLPIRPPCARPKFSATTRRPPAAPPRLAPCNSET